MSYKYLHASKVIENMTKKLSGIRSGRVNASALDNIVVDAYGTKLSIKELATVTSPEPAQLLITPFDKSVITNIEKAIRDSNLGVNPVNDGAGLRLSFPPMTEENRKQRAKEVRQLLEEVRIQIRSTRQDLLKSKKQEKERGEVSEDDVKRFESELQKEVDKLNEEVETMAKNKEEEIMKI